MIYHLLFQEEKGACLYCEGRCVFYARGSQEIAAYFIDEYRCSQCPEEFSIHYLYGQENDPVGFGFTCQDLTCLHHYKRQTIKIARKEAKQHTIDIPVFEYDFTNKEELYQRLSAFLAFS